MLEKYDSPSGRNMSASQIRGWKVCCAIVTRPPSRSSRYRTPPPGWTFRAPEMRRYSVQCTGPLVAGTKPRTTPSTNTAS
eukprot:scaffold5844_cov105-Pinguiococcus_pyrenoidosus.AAC.1